MYSRKNKKINYSISKSQLKKNMVFASEASTNTVNLLLPKWCQNISNNIPYIKKYGPLSKLLCKTYPECWKLTKLKDIFYSTNEYDVNYVTKECSISKELIEQSYQLCLLDGSSYAGTEACKGCNNYTSANKPALIIGNGPSLVEYNHLSLLKEHGFKGDIFCVSAALKKVIESGTIPLYFGSIDAEEHDTSFINHDIIKNNFNKITGLFSINIHPSTNELFTGNRLFYQGHIENQVANNISHVFYLMTKCPSTITCGNIGTSLISIAISLGYNPIVLIGMDLSFSTFEGMKEYYDTIEHSFNPNKKERVWIDKQGKKQYKEGINPLHNKKYYIDIGFESYAFTTILFIENLQKTENINVINCTEQGSIHSKYIKNMKFEDYLKGSD